MRDLCKIAMIVLVGVIISTCIAGEVDVRDETSKAAEEPDPKPSPTPTSTPVPAELTTEWETTDDDEEICLPLPDDSEFTYDFVVDWGDEKEDEIEDADIESGDCPVSHTYEDAGTYDVTIKGTLDAWSFAEFPHSKDKLLEVEELGDMGWKNLEGAFYECTQLTEIGGGNTDDVTTMKDMFAGATALDDLAIDGWNTGKVEDMSGMFANAVRANPDIDSWRTGAVTDMSRMFHNAAVAEPDVSEWDVSEVTDMSLMFANAEDADPDMADWDLAEIEKMDGMFRGAASLSTTNYSNLLKALADANPTTASVLDGGEATYNDTGAEARFALIDAGWTIYDGGPE